MTKLEKARANTERKRRWMAALSPERRAAINARRRERYASNPEPYIREARAYRQWQREQRERRRLIAAGEMADVHALPSVWPRSCSNPVADVNNGQSI